MHDIGVRILRGELAARRPAADARSTPSGETVSRTVVREAIKVLAAKGLVVARPKTGTQVRERRYWNLMDPDVLAWRLEANPGDDFFLDVFELRRLIEPAAAGLAAARATPRRGRRARDTPWPTWRRAVDDRDAYLAADLRFHTVILEACHNELLAHLGGTLRAVFRASFARRCRSPATRSGSTRPSRRRSARATARRRGGDARPDRAHGCEPRASPRRRARPPADRLRRVLEQHLGDDPVAVVHQRERLLEARGGKAVRDDRIELDEPVLEQAHDARPRRGRVGTAPDHVHVAEHDPVGGELEHLPLARRCRAARRGRRAARAGWRARPPRRRRPSRSTRSSPPPTRPWVAATASCSSTCTVASAPRLRRELELRAHGRRRRRARPGA